MKNIAFTLLFALAIFPYNSIAKYNPPKDVPQISRAQKSAAAELSSLDKDNDEKLSKEEFVSKTSTYTRTDEKNLRRARKKGYYQTPEQQFKAADKDEDGYLSYKELSDYIKEYQKNDKGRAQYY